MCIEIVCREKAGELFEAFYHIWPEYYITKYLVEYLHAALLLTYIAFEYEARDQLDGEDVRAETAHGVEVITESKRRAENFFLEQVLKQFEEARPGCDLKILGDIANESQWFRELVSNVYAWRMSESGIQERLSSDMASIKPLHDHIEGISAKPLPLIEEISE